MNHRYSSDRIVAIALGLINPKDTMEKLTRTYFVEEPISIVKLRKIAVGLSA